MAYGTSTISNSLSSDADFRTWGSSISSLWQTVGLTLTADTGQIDWTTVVRPAVGTFAGYEIFTLTSDTEHANFPLYIRVDYGVGGAQTLQSMKIQIGSSTNGAGTLTGILGTAFTCTANGTANTGSWPHYCSAGDGYFAYAGTWNPGGSTSNALFNTTFIIERLRDNTGAPTDDGIYSFFAGTWNSVNYPGRSQIIRPDDAALAYSSSFNDLRIGAYVPNRSGNRGTDLYLYTHQPADYAIYNPCLSNLFYYYTDLAALTSISVDMYGTSRTFLPLGRHSIQGTNWQTNAFGHINSGLALRWE